MLGRTWTWIILVVGVVAVHLAVHFPYINGDESVKAHSSSEPDDLAVKIIDDLMNKSNPRVRPGVNSRNSTYVKIDFYVQSLGPLNEMEMEFATDLDFRETWVDERLSFNSTTEDPVYIPSQNTKEFWIPDIYFPNEKNGQSHDITIPNKSIRIYPNGTIRYLIRINMRLSCTMYLANFPFDSQTCYIKISTYSYEEKEIQLRWLDCAPIEIKKSDLQLPQFHLVDYWPTKCTESYKTGNFSCLLAVFEFERMVGYYVLQTYIPSVLIVILSWIAFFINKDSEPARVVLGVTTVLTMTTQLTTSRSNTMRVSYLKAIDVWYATCMMFVFAALIEYAFVNVCSRQEKNRNGTHKKDDDRDVETQMLESSETCDGKMQPTERVYFYSNWKYTSKNIDWVSRRVFPSLFLFFNLFYWTYYMCQMSANKDNSKPIYCDA